MKEKQLYETHFRDLILFALMVSCFLFLPSSLSSGATVYYLISFEVSIAALLLYGDIGIQKSFFLCQSQYFASL